MTISPYEPQPHGEIVQYQPGSSVAALREWAEAARAAYTVAQSLAKTTFVPVDYRGKPDEITAAILAGHELGFSPIASVNAFSPIQGRAAPNAITLRAVVQSRGHEIELIESTPQRCVMRGRRAGAERWQTSTWTLDRARQLLDFAKREQWRKQPQAMLVARATSEICRLVAADAILGIPYSAEELRDQGAEAATQNGTAPRARRQTAVAPIAPAAPMTAVGPPVQAGPPPLPGEAGYAADDAVDTEDEAAAEEYARAEAELAETRDSEAVAEPAEDAAGDTATDDGPPEQRRMRRLFALIRESDVGDRHQYASGVLKREVTSYQTLTATDVETLIGNLEAISDPPLEET